MRRLSVLDAAWLTVESKETPMHVGSLQIYSLPENAPSDYVQKMVDQLRSAKSFAPPWNLQIKPSPLSKAMPAVRERHDVDMEYHVRHSALPRPGGERELGELISRLHARGLDLTRPLWECHLIEGLEGNRIDHADDIANARRRVIDIAHCIFNLPHRSLTFTGDFSGRQRQCICL